MAIAAGDIEHKRLGGNDAELIGAFVCEKPGCQELVEFVRYHAASEQDANFSTTFLFTSVGHDKLDAYLTLSAAGVALSPRAQERLGTRRRFIPSVMIDYVAVASHRDHQGLGLHIFEWVQSMASQLNRDVGVRFVVLGVRAVNWGAYRVYVKSWGFTALPVKNPSSKDKDAFVDAPDPDAPKPDWMPDDYLIHMYFDLVEKNGAFVDNQAE
jgi:hypothetical protein